MNNINLTLNICYLLITSGVIGALGQLLSKKAKNKHFADGLIHAQTIASQLVVKHAINPTIPKGQLEEAVTHDLQVVLDKHGYHFSVKYLEAVAAKEIHLYVNKGGHIKDVPTPAPKEALQHVNDRLNNQSSTNNSNSISNQLINK